jgi:hypothetical protein
MLPRHVPAGIASVAPQHPPTERVFLPKITELQIGRDATTPTSKVARVPTTLETTNAPHEKLESATVIGRLPTNRNHLYQVSLIRTHGPNRAGRAT